MTWEKIYHYIQQYEYVSTNQHGNRYKKTAKKQICSARLTADVGDTCDLQELILMSHHLNVPIHYDFKPDPHTVYIEIVAKETIL